MTAPPVLYVVRLTISSSYTLSVHDSNPVISLVTTETKSCNLMCRATGILGKFSFVLGPQSGPPAAVSLVDGLACLSRCYEVLLLQGAPLSHTKSRNMLRHTLLPVS